MNKIALLALILGFIAVSAAADDLRIRIDDVFTSTVPVEGETFTLTVMYTISNPTERSITAEDMEIELDLPDTIVGKHNKTIPSVRIAAGTSITEFAYFTNLKALQTADNERVVIELSVKDHDPVLYSYTFDILTLPEFKVSAYPENPSLGEKVKISGDIWPVITEFVGTDIEGEKVIVQKSNPGYYRDPARVVIMTEWGNFYTYTNQHGQFEYWISPERAGQQTITVMIGDNTTSTTIDVQGFKVQMQVVPDVIEPGDTMTIIGRVNLPYQMLLPVILQVGKLKYVVTTDNYGVFRKEITMQDGGEFTITAMAEHRGMIGKAQTKVNVIAPVEAPHVEVTASLPTSALAGTTVILQGYVDKGGIRIDAPLEIEMLGEIKQLNVTKEGFALSFVAPADPGYYPVDVRTNGPEGEGEEKLELRVVPYSEARIQIKPDKNEYKPGDAAVITYTLNLTRPIETDLTVRAMKYGKVIYEESNIFSQSKTGNFTITLDAGEYTVEVETLGARKSTTFRCFTPYGWAPAQNTNQTKELNVTLGSTEKAIESSRITLPLLVGAVALGIVLLV